jgi:hypothetical protein
MDHIPTGRLVSVTGHSPHSDALPPKRGEREDGRESLRCCGESASSSRWPIHLIAGMAATLGMLLFMTIAVLAATDERREQSRQTQPIALKLLGTGLDLADRQSTWAESKMAGPEAAPMPREIVIRVVTVPAPPAPPPAPVAEPRCGKDGCAGIGTRIDFEATVPAAFERARRENKMVFVVHLSGHLEDPGFT